MGRERAGATKKCKENSTQRPQKGRHVSSHRSVSIYRHGVVEAKVIGGFTLACVSPIGKAAHAKLALQRGSHVNPWS